MALVKFAVELGDLEIFYLILTHPIPALQPSPLPFFRATLHLLFFELSHIKIRQFLDEGVHVAVLVEKTRAR